jgi:peptidoglycan/LPS O-acetylase OafA/YrhL
VLYHAHVPGITGGYVGVDVFFVISGFLITGQLERELDCNGRISFLHFYGRRARRLLPPAALVVVVTILCARLWSTTAQIRALVKDVFYTAGYGLNVHLAHDGVQYQNASAPPSPLQHFWSLAVEEQFYAVWPVLLAVCAVIARRRRAGFTTVVLVALTAGSLFASVVITRSDTATAYFSLQTRAWELGCGALVALASTRLARLSPVLAAGMSWLGLAAILAAGLVYDDTTAYPGSAAALPVLGAAVLIAAGCAGRAAGAERVLAGRIPQLLGRHSYSWYLWHWPMLILLPQAVGASSFSWLMNLEIVVLALWAAILTYFLENAAHRSALQLGAWVPSGFALSGAMVVAALAVGATLLPAIGTGAAQAAPALLAPDTARIQTILADALTTTEAPRNLTPRLDAAVQDEPASSADGCHRDLLSTQTAPCVYGSNAPGAPVAVLLGDSHAQQWLGGLLPSVRKNGWRLQEWTKAACPVANVLVWNDDLKRTYPECSRWRTTVLQKIVALHPALIIASQSDAVVWTSMTNHAWADKTAEALRTLAGQGTRIVYLADTPQTTDDPLACLERHLSDVRACSYASTAAFQGSPVSRSDGSSSVTPSRRQASSGSTPSRGSAPRTAAPRWSATSPSAVTPAT